MPTTTFSQPLPLEHLAWHHVAMARTRPIDYAGAAGRTDLDRAPELPARYWYQPKVDGAYCHVSTDTRGRIAHVLLRGGREAPAHLVADLIGQDVRAPRSVFAGELDGFTEAGLRRLERQGGSANIHLFDCIRYDGEYLARRPYRYRYGALQHTAAQMELACNGRRYIEDRNQRAHNDRGRFVRQQLTTWRRLPVVPLWHPRELEDRWAEEVDENGGEGLVAVNVEARLGQRRSKLKLKRTDTLDAVVVEMGPRNTLVEWAGRLFTTGVGPRGYDVGSVVELTCNGFGADGAPRHARISRVRSEM